jgi:hypothetical protein
MPREAAVLMEALKDAETGKAQEENGNGLETSIEQIDLAEGVSPRLLRGVTEYSSTKSSNDIRKSSNCLLLPIRLTRRTAMMIPKLLRSFDGLDPAPLLIQLQQCIM